MIITKIVNNLKLNLSDLAQKIDEIIKLLSPVIWNSRSLYDFG